MRESLDQSWRPLAERILRGHPRREMYQVTRTLSVPAAVNSAAVEHVRVVANTVSEKRDEGVTPGRDRQRPEIVHEDRDSRSRRVGDRDDGPTNRQVRYLPRLAVQGVPQPQRGDILIPIHE